VKRKRALLGRSPWRTAWAEEVAAFQWGQINAVFGFEPVFSPISVSQSPISTPCSLRYHILEDRIGARMFVVVWQFEIAEEKTAAFEAAYGPEGAWAKLFRTSPNYLGTDLMRDAYIPGGYLTIDRWTSEEDFRAFRKDHDAEYESLDRSSDALTSREARIGAYIV